MADILPKSLDKDTDWDRWDEFLLDVDKDKIIDFLLSRMSSDEHFMKLAYEYFNGADHRGDVEVESLLKAYACELEYECSQSIPDVDFIVSLTERFIRLAEEIATLYGKVQFYVSLIVKLDKSVALDGAGMYGDDDFLIVEEMESIDHILTAEIDENKDAISEDEKKEIIAFIKSSQQEYKISLMEDKEYLENIKKLFD